MNDIPFLAKVAAVSAAGMSVLAVPVTGTPVVSTPVSSRIGSKASVDFRDGRIVATFPVALDECGGSFQIFSLNGARIYSMLSSSHSGVVSVPVSHYAPGVYYVKAAFGKSSVLKQVVIK